MLHGARGDGDRTLEQQRAVAEQHGVILLCPSTRSGTWDAIRGDFAHDFTRLDELLTQTFDRCNVDATRIASAGFSDGATYALSIGLMNGDLFTHIVAHSPGFIISDERAGKPAVYISHGRQDEVLPFDRCGARIAAELEREGYAPRFDIFEGGHTASPEIRGAALQWFTESPRQI
jgi:phospholipase/carboxylesterase